MNKIVSNTISSEKCLLETIQVAPPETPVIVDFDHTLFLSNSTEEYLNSIRPRWLIALIFAGLDFLKPWRIFRAEKRDFIYRDHLRVVVATLLFPWILVIWNRRAAFLAAEFGNDPLIHILKSKDNPNIILASYGYSFIIKPLLKHFPIPVTKVLGAKFLNGYSIRKQGKLSMIQKELGDGILKQSIFITDSLADQPVLVEARYPVMIQWPKEKVFTALRDVYLPYIYTEKAKYPGHGAVLKNFLLDDIPTLLLSVTFVHGFSVSSITATFLFYTAFICVYELGYRENDFVAVLSEKNPTVSAALEEYRFFPIRKYAWIWAGVLSFLAITILNWNPEKGWEQIFREPAIFREWDTLILWMAFLVLVRVLFWIHNSMKVDWRTFSFLSLQFVKMFGFILVMPTNVIGACYMGAHVLGRWMRYSIYRQGGNNISFPDKIARLVIFAFSLVVIVLFNKDFSILFSAQVGLMILWWLLRGGHQILWPFKSSP